jgi:hypothetical protein
MTMPLSQMSTRLDPIDRARFGTCRSPLRTEGEGKPPAGLVAPVDRRSYAIREPAVGRGRFSLTVSRQLRIDRVDPTPTRHDAQSNPALSRTTFTIGGIRPHGWTGTKRGGVPPGSRKAPRLAESVATAAHGCVMEAG